MSSFFKHYRFLLLRRITQVSLLVLYFGANAWGWHVLQGNLSSSLVLDTIPLSDPYATLQLFAAGGLVATNLLVGALIITLFYFVIGGRAFCSWVCPMNMVTDFAAFLREKLEINRIQDKQPATRKMRYWILGLSFILSLFLGVAAFEFVSPISMLHRGIIFGMGFGWAAVAVIFLFDLFVLKNGWCGHLCPLGGFYSLLGRYSFIRVRHSEEKCTLCMKCKQVCPEHQVLFMVGKESLQVLDGECTNCGRCVEVCEDDALNFSIRNYLGNTQSKGE
ncbi:MAG: quinol dehydrogenase ferredoxin subunit NapH [Thiovulaceae bacterium]|jgi:ferredoxin-type protein NapH|nr:quinol dehydrogenase ferredoxin subunit NapH [Sulfurimonadaceae bacterium]MDD3817104.1 quinol dehydrogenase ferredoxin subunit NapH [Sulfurimonadaceae bacterium]